VLTAGCILLPCNSHGVIIVVESRLWALRAALVVSWSALVFNVSSEVKATHSVEDVDNNITIVSNVVARCISIVVQLHLLGECFVLCRRSVRCFWSVWLNMFVLFRWAVDR